MVASVDDITSSMARLLLTLLQEEGALAHLSSASATIADGKGVQRILTIMGERQDEE
ncbi:hypothetical protein D3C84_1282650 [compost metagenome]